MSILVHSSEPRQSWHHVVTRGAPACTPAAAGSATAGTLHLFILAGGAISRQTLRNCRLVQQEGGALTRPAALAAEQLLESGAVQAPILRIL
jgi:hypothetical protein